ncbi:MAG: response regulator transcription factor [Acidimicrobiia bacterium]
MTTVVLADDHQLLRQALRHALEEQGFAVVGEAADGEEAVRLVADHHPDLVVMDVSMPVLDGIEATRMIHSRTPEARILVLTMHDEPALVADAVGAGAVGFLTKGASMQEVIAAVRDVAAGEILVSPEIASSMLAELTDPEPPHPESPLTAREEEILQLVADGRSTTEVARDLFISAKTVKNHLGSIYAKLDAADRTQAVVTGVRIGIIDLH